MRFGLALAVALALVVSACTIDDVDLGGKDCPCLPGFVCDPESDTCVRELCEQKPDLAACPGGTCRSGKCCQGCWDGVSCVDGSQASACGASGASCRACECAASDQCVDGQCVPSDPVVDVDVGYAVVQSETRSAPETHSHTCAVTTSGKMWCWGSNSSRQLGVAGEEISAPTEVVVVDPPGSTNVVEWTNVYAGGQFTCARDGTNKRWCWGRNVDAELGIGTDNGDNVEPAKPDVQQSIHELAAGKRHACNIDANTGRLTCWGDRENGATTETADKSADTPSPTAISGEPWTTVSSFARHTCAIRTNELSCWGYNPEGELGIGHFLSPIAAPTVVEGPIEPPAWEAVAAGAFHTCAINAGALACWGGNQAGQLGRGTLRGAKTNTPNLLDAGSGGQNAGWTAVFAGENTSCALRDGRLFCWGDNTKGQLGLSDLVDLDTPTQVGDATDWEKLSLGGTHACGIRVGGALYCWGIVNNAGSVVPLAEARICL